MPRNLDQWSNRPSLTVPAAPVASVTGAGEQSAPNNRRPAAIETRAKSKMKTTQYQPKTGKACSCRSGQERDNCRQCEGTGHVIDFAAIRARNGRNVTKPLPTPHSTRYQYRPETIAAANKIPAGCVNEQSHKLGMEHGEPLIVILDALAWYAAAHKARYESAIGDDYVLGAKWMEALMGVHGLLNGDGAVAMASGRTTDSKDNGACEAMFEEALKVAGFDRDELGI